MKADFKILCPYCNAPYTAEMLLEVYESGGGCDTCGPDSADVLIDIKCSQCKKTVYKKEGKSYDF